MEYAWKYVRIHAYSSLRINWKRIVYCAEQVVREDDCPNDVYSLAAAQLSKAAQLISTAEAQPAHSPDRPDWSHTALLQMLDKADRLLSQTGTLAMNAEAAMWVGRSAFLRRRVSGSWDDAERSALSRLNSTGLIWAAAAAAAEPVDALQAAVPGPRIHVAHAAAVLTGARPVLGLRAPVSCAQHALAHSRLVQLLDDTLSLRCEVAYSWTTPVKGGTP